MKANDNSVTQEPLDVTGVSLDESSSEPAAKRPTI